MRRPRRALAAAAIFGMVGGSLATMGTAQAAVTVSGSTIDSAGNYVAGTVYVYTAGGSLLDTVYSPGGAFDVALEDGSYKLEFRPSAPEHRKEYYRDKADLATADVVTVAGAAQTLAAWTIDAAPTITGVVRTTDGRPVRNAQVSAYDAGNGTYVDGDSADRNGAFTLATGSAAVKIEFRGYDPLTGDPLATEWFNDKPSKATADPVTATTAGTNLGVVTLGPGGTISGRITNEFGSPLHRAEACAGSDCDYTDANGAYTIEGVDPGDHKVEFYDPIGEYVGEYWNNVPLTSPGSATLVTVAASQAVTGVDAALAAAPVVAPNGVDVSGTVRDQLGNLAVGYQVDLYNTPADPRDSRVVAETITNRAGKYHFTELDRIGGETEFRIRVEGEEPREEGDFARRTTWNGNHLGQLTAPTITAAPQVIDFVLPVAGGVTGTITSEAGGMAENAWVFFRNKDLDFGSYAEPVKVDGSYDDRTLWAGTYVVQFGASLHVSEWWKDALPEDATTITVEPGKMVTGISAVLSKTVKAVERPEVLGDAWVGKTLRLDRGRWNTEGSSGFTYEWLSGSTVVATGPTLVLTKAHLGKQLVGRVTNDAGFTAGQALSAATAKVGYEPKLKSVVAKAKSIAMVLKAKPLKAKKIKAAVVVFKVQGKNAEGELKLKKLGKAKIAHGEGVAKLKKALSAGKHRLLFRITGMGKVGSGDLIQKVKVTR